MVGSTEFTGPGRLAEAGGWREMTTEGLGGISKVVWDGSRSDRPVGARNAAMAAGVGS